MNAHTDPHPVEVLIVAAWITAEAIAALLAALVALHRRRRPALPPAPAVLALPPAPDPAPALDALNVAELRRLARAAGLPRALSRSGRRADLLAALAAA